MISRGLIISLVVTGVSTACLYLYFKNRLGAVEEKVGLILDIIQDHEQRQMQMEAQDNIKVSLSEPIKSEENQEIPNLIQVSDSDEDSGDDSDDDSDENKSDNGEVSGEEIVLEEKKENVQINDDLNVLSEVENIQIDNKDEKMKLQQPQDLDSLDELSDGTDDSESDEEKEKEEKTDYTKLTVVILKELANKKGLTGYKSLKKAALINLIENN